MGKRKQLRRKRGPRGMGQMGTGSVNTKHELGIQVVDYFDYDYGPAGSISEGGVKHYYWNVDQNLFNNNTLGTSGQEASFCRVRKCDVYILPRIPQIPLTDPAFNSNASAMYTCNVQAPGLAGYTRPAGAVVGSSVALGTNVQVTNILPRIDTCWKHVFSCDLQKTYQSGVVRPFYYENLQCLFSMRVLDPTDGTQYLGAGNEAFKIRVKVVLSIDQPIMPVQTASKYLLANNDVGTPDVNASGNPPPSSSTLRSEYVQMDLKGVRSNFS
jgi:hypothetical protein